MTVGRSPIPSPAVTDLPADAVAFPELDDEQLASSWISASAAASTAGEVLFSPADDHYDWVVILSGAVEVARRRTAR